MASTFSSFSRRTDGNIALLTAVFLPMLLMAGGAGLDYARAANARTIAQEAADAALLRVSRLKTERPSMTDAQLSDAAREIFDRATASLHGYSVGQFTLNFDATTGASSIDVDGAMPTELVRVFGYKTMDVPARSEVKLGAPPYMEIVMALDNTGSMNDDGKLDSLKKSASALVETLFDSAGGDVKVGLVPFAQYVNVGASNVGASWLGAAPAGWQGCVGSRAYPLNTEDAGYASPVPAVAGDICPSAIQPLTTDKGKVLSAIDGMKGAGWTYIAEGVAWGWRVLSSGAPFTGGLTTDEVAKRNGLKALIVLTDGMNTRAPSYPLHDSADTASADALTGRLCEEAKKDGLVVYTIAFGVSDAGVRTLLEDCGTTRGHYFEPSNAAELSAAFERIAKSLRNLSLSK